MRDAGEAARPAMLADHELFDAEGGFWVFGYGSLMWRPEFAHVARRQAVLEGYARRFCLWSVRYRGTPEAPGLVLGLVAAPGGATRGMAYRVAAPEAAAVRAYLVEREMSTYSYVERLAPIRLLEPCASGATTDVCEARALVYVMNTTHAQFAGELPLEEQARIIAARRGEAGPNYEYLFNTVTMLRGYGLSEAELDGLDRLEALVRAERAARR